MIRPAMVPFAAAVAVALTLTLPATSAASLGDSVSSVEVDRAQMKSALVRITRQNTYTVHEMLSPTGTTVREYYGANGIVFGVSWSGQFPPDLRQIFGGYFDRYQSLVQQRRRKARGRMAVEDNALIVRSAGHTRSFSGMAYAPNLIPAGVSPSVVR